MKKVTCLLAALLLMCGLSWAQQITWSAADQGYENGQVIESVDFNDYVAGEFFKGTNNNAPKYYTTGAAIRCYGGNYFTITSDYVLTEIVFGFATGEGSNAITSNVGTYEDGTWTGSANEVTFTISGTSGHRRFATFTITYDEGGNPAPVINANNVEIAYDATEGAIEYTINNGVEGGVLTAATESDWLTIGTVGETVPFTCSVNPDGERMATVVLTYTYDTDQTVIKNVTVTQLTNPNAPGSEANPYTVAQARAAIDAGAGTQGVYATGIVSAIPTAYNSSYGNVTFNMVDEEGDEEFLQAYRCGGDEAANVTIGDVVVVYGNLTKYGSTYEFGQGCEVVSLTHPVITDPTITIDPAVVNVDADEHDGTLALAYANLTINNMEDFDVQYCNAEGQEAEAPEWIEVLVAEQDPTVGEGYVVSYYMIANDGEARTVYFKVYALDDETNLVYSNLVTVNQAAYVAPALDYAELPFAFNGGKADIEGTDGLTQEGLGSDYNATSNPTTQLKFDGTGDWLLLHFNEAPGTLTFDIKGNGFSGGTFTVQTSEDGETYEDLAAYTELGGAETKTFDNLDENARYIKWIYTEKSSGNVGLGNIYLYEVGGGPAPEASITVAPATVNVDAAEHDGTLSITYENIPDLISFDYYFCDAEGNELEDTDPNYPDWIVAEIQEEDENYSVYYVIEANEGEARTAYFKVYTPEVEDVYALVTINQAAYVAPVLDYAELPFAFNGGKADIEETDGLTQEGLGNDYNATSNPTTQLKFDGTGDWMLLHFNEAPGTLTFDIKGNSFNGGTFTVQTSEDGVTYEDLAAYTELGDVETKTFSNLDENVRYIKWIYTEKSQGNVGLGDIHLYEVGGGPAPVPSITFNPDVFNFDAEQHVLQIPFTYENIEVTNYASFTTHFYNAEGEEIQLVQGEAWYYCSVTEIINGEGYQLTGVVIANEGEARSAYIKVSALDAAGETVYSNLVTVNQAAPEIPFEGATYTLVNYIESGRHYIITNGIDNAMGGQNNNNRAAVEITVEDGVAQVDSEDVFEFVINGPDIDGFYTIYDAAYPGYLYAASNSSNHLKTRAFNTDANSLWSIEFDEETNVATIIAQGDNSHNWMRYNNSGLFSCYGETSNQQDIYLFVKDDDTYEFYMDIKGYTEGENDAWYAISTPVNTNPTNVNHMLDDTFDLYMFNPTDANGEVWQNYKVNNFVLTPGEGYLYANENNVTLRFAGAVEDLYDGDGTVALPYYNEENEDLCWNLVGNPFGYAAYTMAWNFYVMKEDGSDFELAERDMLNPFEAIFVKAEFEGDETFFFNDDINPGGTGGGGVHPSNKKLNVRVSDENGKGDFARVRFGEGNNLEKFMLNPANTKIYFPMEDNDYAVVYADNMGEMPLNFSAAADGDYTLNINPENIEMEYLHLIDNMTGTDVDLLATPSYSFHARVNDNAARFTLVFANLTGMDENNADQFAFFSNGNLIVSNEGNAMLQVVDVTGRIVKSESINGTASVSVNATPGVYMLRLINGDNVKVQKVVVK